MLIQIFWIFVVWKYDMIFFWMLGRMLENKNIFLFYFIFNFSMFWRKLSILILDLYLYSIKIQANTKQNSVGKSHTHKHTHIYIRKFKENFLFLKKKHAKLGWVWPIKIQTITYWDGRSPIKHKCRILGWTQPSHLDWVESTQTGYCARVQ